MKKASCFPVLFLFGCTIDDKDMHCEKLLDRIAIASSRCDDAQDNKRCKHLRGFEFSGLGCGPCFAVVDLLGEFDRHCKEPR